MQQQRKLLDYIIITLKGMAMGAADVVPGVSGGTIAFISGIYEELITSINNIKFSLLKSLFKQKFSITWKKINGSFLLSLLIGIIISILSLAKAIKWLLENQPILLWSFFFGLVLASIIFIGKQIKRWNAITIIALLLGAIVAFYITTLPPMSNTQNSIFLFFAGALAICAMILPGVSGAFILVLLGAYKTLLDAVDEKNIKIIAITTLGAIVGVFSFSKLLKWTFNNYRNTTLAVLTGFVIGSLNKIWPWKKVLKTKIYGDKIIPISEKSISPFNFEGNNQLMLAIFIAVIGFLTIFILEKIASKSPKKL